ncbi:Aluminum-activated malate transporter [Dillenia turbinata]|uniref:Aluminum-activated malate transporter n=1 Tax=Dillenia turbinata TaxID=194707 RepID=A0AAN8ZKJ3_9MAGN
MYFKHEMFTIPSLNRKSKGPSTGAYSMQNRAQEAQFIMDSIAISVPTTVGTPVKQNKIRTSILHLISFSQEQKNAHDMMKIIHSIKVGIALLIVSLLFLLDPLFEKVGENAMWAIMTVVVIFEYYAGATLSKGLNRGMGTILGGGLGCLAAIIAQEVGGLGKELLVGSSVFVFGTAATYIRMVPRIKMRYDYGAMIFIITFNLIAVSGLRADEVMELARQRLSTIGMGFTVCIFTSILIFPLWASDELHYSIASKFETTASSLEGCLEEYFKVDNEKEIQLGASLNACKSVLHSKSKDETLANFARWEPWHGRFGLSHPWEKYLQIGEVLRELATTIFSMQGCIQSVVQSSSNTRQLIKEPCEAVGSILSWTLRDLGESILKMKRCRPKVLISSKLQSVRLELDLATSPGNLGVLGHGDELATPSFVFFLMEAMQKVEILAKEIEELGELADFQNK